MEEQKNNNKVVKAGVVALVLVVAYFGYFKYTKNEQAVTAKTGTQSEVPSGSQNQNSGQMVYRDGKYTAVGTYAVPVGVEHVSVELVIRGDVVTDATVTNNGERPESKGFQDQFISGYKTYVIGKKIDQISVTKVSGSSLTPKGFMDALSQIKAEAKA